MSQRQRVVVLGSLHYDITVETPNWPSQGETAVGSAWAPKLGGKGRNQAVAAARAGAATEMIGAVVTGREECLPVRSPVSEA